MKRSCNWITKGFAILLSTTMLMSMLPANTASASKRNYNPVDVATLTSSVNTTVEDVTNEVDTKYELTKASIDESKYVTAHFAFGTFTLSNINALCVKLSSNTFLPFSCTAKLVTVILTLPMEEKP